MKAHAPNWTLCCYTIHNEPEETIVYNLITKYYFTY